MSRGDNTDVALSNGPKGDLSANAQRADVSRSISGIRREADRKASSPSPGSRNEQTEAAPLNFDPLRVMEDTRGAITIVFHECLIG